jgi:hypothetical chaperone protein
MGIRVGVDFGTSNSGVGYFDGRQVHLLPVDWKNPMPEVVKTILYITRDDKPYIGQEAVELYYRHNVNRQRRWVKKWAGEIEYRGADLFYVRDVYVYIDELQPGRLLQYLKTTLRKMGVKGGYRGTRIFERDYSVADLIQVYLAELKKRAEQALGEPVRGVTLGRPVKFSDDPEQDRLAENTLLQAAHQAGFEEVDFELEPIAAALYYEQSLVKPQTTLIFDFGGGTLDIAILRLGDKTNRKVYANGGIDIAGSDFDRAIIEKRLLRFLGNGLVDHQPALSELVQSVPDWIALPELSTPLNRQNILNAIQAKQAPVQMKALQALIFNDLAFSFYNQVESAKIALSNQGSVVIRMDDRDIHLWELYARAQFEKDIWSMYNRIEQVVLATIVDSGLEPEQIDAVVKTGGSSSIPLFTSLLERIFGVEKVVASHPFNSVTAGLAIKANRMN